MSDETMRILSMVESGKITAEQAAALLSALGKRPVAVEPTRPGDAPPPGRAPTWIGIYVTDAKDGEQVRVKVPFALVSCVEKFVPKGVMARVKAGDEEIDIQELMDSLRKGMRGDVLTVDAQDGTHVRICCE